MLSKSGDAKYNYNLLVINGGGGGSRKDRTHLNANDRCACFTPDFSPLLNTLQAFNKFNKHVLFKPISKNSTSILPDQI